MTAELFSALVVFAFVAAATPGPNNAMLLASGVNYGFRRTLPHMFGITVGFGVMILLIGFGFGQLFVRLPWLYDVLKVVSIGYMLWLAWQIAISGPVTANEARSDARPLTAFEAAAFQWVNPKAWTSSLGAVSAYTVPAHYTSGMITVAAVFTIISPFVTAAWTAFGVSLRGLLSDPKRMRIFNVTMALALVASLLPVILEYWH